MFVSLVGGPIDRAFGGGNIPAFVMGAIAAIGSALLAIFFLPKPPKQINGAIPVTVVGGGH